MIELNWFCKLRSFACIKLLRLFKVVEIAQINKIMKRNTTILLSYLHARPTKNKGRSFGRLAQWLQRMRTNTTVILKYVHVFYKIPVAFKTWLKLAANHWPGTEICNNLIKHATSPHFEITGKPSELFGSGVFHQH